MKKSLAEIIQLNTPMPIVATEATMTKIGQRHTGVGQYGQWALQDIELTDGQSKMIAVFADRDEMPADQVGQRISLISYNGKNGLTGVKTKVRKGKKQGEADELVLYVTATAEVTKAANFGQFQNPAQQQQPQQNFQPPQQQNFQPPAQQQQPAPRSTAPPPPQQPAQSAPAPANKPTTSANDPGQAVFNTWQMLERAGNLYAMALMQGVIQRRIFDGKYPQNKMTDAHFQAMVASLFINCDHLAVNLPVGDIDKFLP